MFVSKLEQPPTPFSDVFNYVFHYGRRAYPWTKVIYRVDGTDESLTLAQLEEKSRRLASSLIKEYDIAPGHVVSIYAKDRIQYPIALFGASAAGATIALIPYQNGMSAEDVGSRLLQSQTRLLITDSALLGIAEAASGLVGGVPTITLDQPNALMANVEELVAQGSPDANCFELKSHEEAEAHQAFINRTSGSTGQMKSVLTSHSHYIATLEGTIRTIPENTDPSTDVWLASSSLGFFINAKLFMSLNILLGIPVVIMPEPLDEHNFSIIERHFITFILVFPPLIAKLAKSDLQPDNVRSIKWLLSAGATVPQNLRQAISDRFLGLDLTLEWGTSETMLIAVQTSDRKSRRKGSSGTLVNGMQARVISTETGEDLGANKAGEILVRNSLASFQGYKDNDVANRDFDAEGWFHTGDYGYLDEDCNVYIIDRLKELLRVGDGYGSRISVSELEDIVFEHPAVGSVIVIGIRDELSATDLPTAFIVPSEQYRDRAGRDVALEIENFVSSKLTGLRSLTGGVYFVDHYPTTGFKISRRALTNSKLNKVTRVLSLDDEQQSNPVTTKTVLDRPTNLLLGVNQVAIAQI